MSASTCAPTFELSFDLYLGNKDAAGADGMAFVLHNDPFGGDATGGGGGFLGALGIRYGVAIEFDTYQNAAFGDIANDHTNFVDTDAPLDPIHLSNRLVSAISRTASGTASRCHGTQPSRR